ncbi:unnamed protein product [Urochloa humidicola]
MGPCSLVLGPNRRRSVARSGSDGTATQAPGASLCDPAGPAWRQAVEETVAGKSHVGSNSMFERMSSPVSPAKLYAQVQSSRSPMAMQSLDSDVLKIFEH